MAEEPTGASNTEVETTIDRFEHEIEELEQPLGHNVRQWVFGIIVAVALVGAFLLGSKLSMKDKSGDNVLAITSLDILEPNRAAQLLDKPKVFRWESLSGATSYIVRIQEQGSPTDLIFRETRSNWLELTPEEQARLVRGGRYQWSVRARGNDGWPIGEGEATFGL